MKTLVHAAVLAVFMQVPFFIVQAQVIPNNGFEDWSNGTNSAPDHWQSHGSNSQGFSPVTQSSDRYLGNYSLRLENKIQGSDTTGGTIESKHPNDSGEGYKPCFPINYQYRTLKGFYKFAPQNGDSAVILAMMSNVNYTNPDGFGHIMGAGWCALGAASVFTPFSTADFYNDSVFTGAPDSAYITIAAYKEMDFKTGARVPYPVKGNSVLYVDALNFDTYLSTGTLPGGQKLQITRKFRLVTSADKNSFLAQFETITSDYTTVKIFDMAGRQRACLFDGNMPAGAHELKFDTRALSRGTYLFAIASAKGFTAEILTVQSPQM
jgi:hypothetical protein